MAESNWRKTRHHAGFFYARNFYLVANLLKSRPFTAIGQNLSPQAAQNLVNYHPILCPNAGNCSRFVRFKDARKFGTEG
ncbi:hypothetical protein DOX53_16065 [Cronobacter malonaticus]|uniref:Uncharacterized protein n=1 Tax=Cronobacter malonaticus TaxID=413503 RepID=A0ABX5K3N1_9ENTR|nr:hypothetical protein [Cronobacter malonaticus]EGT4290326.1 hypothetical protein [Cronobacter malonaticus]EGT4298505.1 hypothetical protein [Cronobacter malonaticus]EGT4315336.1 hypothetical protein [Cronobacter malonaticus]EGT4335665.1 hypothetical protein [Cronobacter malonaticus]